MTDSIRSATASPGLPPRVGHILRLAEIIEEVDLKSDRNTFVVGAAALAEAILAHPGFSGCHDDPVALPAQGGVGSTWQPIETAPRDAVEILVLDGRKVKQVVSSGPDVGIFSNESGDEESLVWYPTHWQPLPIPPITPNPHA